MENTENAHAVPQNIMSVEFKLIGDLSLKQFVFIAVPLTLGFIMYVFHVNNYITIVFTGFLLLIALFIDFVPVDDRPLDDLIVNFLIAIKNPTQRVWRKNPEFPNILKIPKILMPQEKKDSEIATFMYQSPIDSNLNSPSSSDASKFLDQREKILIDNIDKLNDSLNSTPSGNSMVSPSINNNIPSSGMNINPSFINPSGNNINSNNPQKDEVNQSQNIVIGTGNTSSNISSQNLGNNNSPFVNNIGVDQNLSKSSSFSNNNSVNVLEPLRKPDPKDFYKKSSEDNIEHPINTAVFNTGSIPTVDPNINPQNPFNSGVGNISSNFVPNTPPITNPNMGVPQMNIPKVDKNYINPNNNPPIQNEINNFSQQPSVNLPPIQPDVTTPIQPDTNISQGQNTVQSLTQTTVSTSFDSNLSEPPDTSSVSVDTNAIPHSYDYLSSSPSETPKIDENIVSQTVNTNKTPDPDIDIKKILEKLEKLEKENDKLKKQVDEQNEKIDIAQEVIDQKNRQDEINVSNVSSETPSPSPQDDISNTLGINPVFENNSIQPSVDTTILDSKNQEEIPSENNLSSAMTNLTSQSNVSTQNPETTKSSKQESLKKEDILKYLPDFVSNPNIISGVVMKNTGQILPDTVIIIKDSSQKPVRAIKTNQLGQFFIRTPLLSGTYNLEIAYQGLTFDPIFIELDDTVKDPMLIYSK